MDDVFAEALVAALDAREHETGEHSRRVACHTLLLAKRFTGHADELQQVYFGALLHDLGKIGIPDAILLKTGSLTDAEWAVMRRHPEIGHAILAKVPGLAKAGEIVLTHEERFDGRGYPRGLAGRAIPLWSRLFAVIDTLDAITSDRPYRKGLPFDAARAEIESQAGSQFDPVAVQAFAAEEETLREMVAAKCQVDRSQQGAHMSIADSLSTLFGRLRGGEARKSAPSVVDPVCGMSVDPAGAAGSCDYRGKTYFFCSKHCLGTFQADPEKHIARAEKHA